MLYQNRHAAPVAMTCCLLLACCTLAGQTPSGTHQSVTTLTSSGAQGGYTLSATIVGNGGPNPTGHVVFTDMTTGATLGTAALGTASTPGGFSNPQTLP